MIFSRKQRKKEIKICFIEAGSPSKHIFSRVPIPRLGTILMATILRDKGYAVKVFIEDIAEPDWREIRTAQIVCISCITSTAIRALKLAKWLKRPGNVIVMGGPHSTFIPEESLKYADFVIRGEGEDAIVELVEHLEKGIGFKDIKGLSFKKNGQIVHNENRPLIKNLDNYPIPDFNLAHKWDKKAFIPVATSRGCPFGCKFCSVIQMFGREYRFKSIDRVIEEIKQYHKKKCHIFFIDDNFAANRKRTKELLKRIIEEDIKIQWSAQVRADCVEDLELIDLMKKAGCYMVYVGFESINPKTLEGYRKKQKLENIVECIRVFKKFGIKIHGMFVLGGDTDDVKTIRNTAKFAKDYDINTIQFLMLTPLPGTPVFYDLEDNGRLIHREWDKYDAHHAVFEPNFMTAEVLHKETIRAMRKFYSWGRLIRKFLAREWFELYITHYSRNLISEALKNEKEYLEKIKEYSNKKR